MRKSGGFVADYVCDGLHLHFDQYIVPAGGY